MFECDLKPYCGENCDQCQYAKELKQRQELAEAVEELKKALWELVEPVADLVIRFVEAFLDVFYSENIRRVVHLAAHSKKKRIRKKNTKRILKWMKKGGRKNG